MPGRLRARRERTCRRAAEQRYELAPFHCPMRPVLPTERIAHLGTADCCIHPPGRNEMITITPPKIFSKEVAQNRPPHFPARTSSLPEIVSVFAYPVIGERPIAKITAPELLAVLRKVEARGRYEAARRLRSTCGMVFRYAIATGRAERDPSLDLRGALTTPKASTGPPSLSQLISAPCSEPSKITTDCG